MGTPAPCGSAARQPCTSRPCRLRRAAPNTLRRRPHTRDSTSLAPGRPATSSHPRDGRHLLDPFDGRQEIFEEEGGERGAAGEAGFGVEGSRLGADGALAGGAYGGDLLQAETLQEEQGNLALRFGQV